MTKDERNLARIRSSALISPSTFACHAGASRRRDIRHLVIPSSFVLRHSTFSVRRAFTLIELIVVIAIIIILAGLVLSTVGYVQKKGARSRAETEIAAMSAACESYKADNGIYPRNSATDNLNAQTSGDPSSYQTASQYLYGELSGDRNFNYVIDPSEQGNRSYFAFKSSPPSVDGTSNSGMLSITRTTDPITGVVSYTVNYIRDPFGNSYAYSTANQAAPANGYNPTFDLWSTAGLTTTPPTATITAQWIKNW